MATRNSAIFAVDVNGANITSALKPILTSLRVRDRAGFTSDTASIEIDDGEAIIRLPDKGASIQVYLGRENEGLDLVFDGIVDEVRSRGSRGSGRTIAVSAKGVDTEGLAKEPQSRHFDGKTVHEILTEAGGYAGISEVKVDDALGSIVRPYLDMRDESFLALGQRLAKEIGGTFKVVGNRATMVKRSGATAPGGVAFPVIRATYGDNLIDWDIAPVLGRPVFKRARVRYYDMDTGKWKEQAVETDIDGAKAEKTDTYAAADEGEAAQRAASGASESERNAGEGRVVIDGNTSAQPEATCVVSGARPGIDGSYRIDGVEHEYSRSGFTTTLELKEPKGGAGVDDREAE